MAVPEVVEPRHIGVSRPRREDAALLSGRSRYMADVVRPGMLHAVFLRSPVAHAVIRSIDTSRALKVPGMKAILTGSDLPEDLGAQPCNHFFGDQRDTPYYALARDRVRFVGEPLAMVIAENRYLAEDARDEVDVDFETLPALADTGAALATDAPLLYEGWPDNVAGMSQTEIGDVDAAFRDADFVSKQRFEIGRSFACPLEGRGALAEWDEWTGDLTLWTSSQILHITRDFLAQVLGIPEHRVRVVVPRVGGGFGGKFHFYQEETAVALAAKAVGQPVRWIEDRGESLLSTVHARQQVVEASIAIRDGAITGIEADIVGDVGAALHTVGYGPVHFTSTVINNAYDVGNVRVRARGVLTNKTPLGSYRGWGQPQANFVIERLVDLAAAEHGLDPLDVRRASFIPPERFPYQGHVHVYDNGRYRDCFDAALELLDDRGWRSRLSELRQAGRHVGIGVSFYVEITALGPSKILNEGGVVQGGYDIARVRMEPDGEVTVYSGVCDMGQGITNVLASVCADYLGVHPDSVNVVTGDTQTCPFTGYGTGASRSATVGAVSVMKAAQAMQGRIRRIAAHMLEVSEGDLEFADGRISVVGSPTRSLTMADVGRAAYIRPVELPDGVDPGLEEVQAFDPTATAWPYGTNIVVAEVDADTGIVEILDYLYVHDCGTMLDPTIVEGQVHGGITQGIGMALYEEFSYGDDAQPQFGSFMDYVLPTAAETPRFTLEHQVTPSPVVPGGMKGIGEAGLIGSPSAVVAAVEDALGEFGVRLTTMPVTPDVVLAAIESAQDGARS